MDDDLNLVDFINLFVRRKWLFICGTFAFALATCLFTIITPRQFHSEALILISQPIVRPGNEDKEGPQVTEVQTSSLDASTYQILAKSDELMLALADTLKTLLPPEKGNEFSPEVNLYDIAALYKRDLEVVLLQDTGQRNIPSTTPLLVFSYKTSQKELAPLVVNAWSDLFLERNQGLSSNVTDSFYQTVVRQYEQAKRNLEQKENELADINAISNEFTRLKKELVLKSAQVDSSLSNYKFYQYEKEKKSAEYKHVNSQLSLIEDENGSWIGYDLTYSDTEKKPRLTGESEKIVSLISDLRRLKRDSTSVDLLRTETLFSLNSEHILKKTVFEMKTNFSLKKARSRQINDILEETSENFASISEQIRKKETRVAATQHVIEQLSPVILTRKAIVDNALWGGLTNSEASIEEEIQSKLGEYRLISEEISPVYLAFSDTLANLKAKLAYLTKVKADYTPLIDSLRIEYINLQKDFSELRIARFRLAEELNNEKANVMSEFDIRNNAVSSELNTTRKSYRDYESDYLYLKSRKEQIERELVQLTLEVEYHSRNYEEWREQFANMSVRKDSIDLERRRLERDAEISRQSFNRFSKLREEARIARQQAAGDIQIVSKSSIPRPIARDTIRKTFLAGLAGFLCMFIFALSSQAIEKRKFLDAA